jgi:hypothetical protein
MDNIAGSPVEGENFFGRDAAVRHLLDTLEHDDILLLGPRRIGKTSAARAVMASVREQDWRAIEINVASCRDEKGFLDKLEKTLQPELASIPARIRDSIGQAWGAISGRIKSVRVPVPGAGSLAIELGASQAEDWTEVGSDFLRLISEADERWLIYVDELPILLFHIIRNDPQAGVQRVRRFLDWFRNDVRALPAASRVRWLIAGSVGLDTLVQEHGMADTINSLNQQTLEPFTPEVATAMLVKLADRYHLELGELDAKSIVDAVQWPQPYYLQVVFNHLRRLISSHPQAKPASLIGQAVDKLIEPGTDNDFHHWEARLSQQLSAPDAAHAHALLDRAARDAGGVQAEYLLATLEERMANAPPDAAQKTFIRLSEILLRDAYWWADESSGAKRYRFRLEPLRRWWLRRNTL